MTMRAILLAAGTGRRLQRSFPKCLVDIGGMTLLSRTLRALAAVKVIEAWIVVGYRRDLIIAELELSDQHQQFERPEWIGAEVTGQAPYYNSFLVRHPFCSWSQREMGVPIEKLA